MSENTKGNSVGYWIATAILAVVLLLAGVMDLLGQPEVTEVMERLGYPMYILALLGIAKLLAAVAILVPKYPRLKEWAYAGVVFNFVGAIYSHISSSEPEQIVTPGLLLVVAFTSWYLRPAGRMLPKSIK